MTTAAAEPLTWDARDVRAGTEMDARTDIAVRNENTGPGWLRAAVIASRAHKADRAGWLWEHRNDASIIPSLSDSELISHRLGADIRADIPLLNAAADELRRRGIRDYPIAV